ncbi:iron-sulfur cluster loop [candidate division KSB1 bacterium]|nr:iron-sulfur cluster loop [candidate division KSB1 bacterium]
MNNTDIQNLLVRRGKEIFNALASFIPFTKNKAADELINDLAHHPHAFVLASIMDRQIKADRAWIIPHKLQEKLGDFKMTTLTKLSKADIQDLLSKPESLHRFVDIMAGCLYDGIQRIENQYDSVASKIWMDKPSSASVVYRFLEFNGIGPKIACMNANILARDFKIKLSDYYSIDISADVHVRRVFTRLGLVPEQASVEQLVYRARGLYPDFPGIMDLPTWEIGRSWCKPKDPNCQACYMREVCPSSKTIGSNISLYR